MIGEENPARRGNAATGEPSQGGAGEAIVPAVTTSLKPAADPLVSDATLVLEVLATRLMRVKCDVDRLIREIDHYVVYDTCAKPENLRRFVTSLGMIEHRVETVYDEVDRLGAEFAVRCRS